MGESIAWLANTIKRVPFWLLCGVVLVISRMATWFFPFDSDHWIFYYIGRRWAEGASLYVDMWDHKSPLIFGFNSLLYRVFGGNIALHRIVFTIIAILTIYCFYIVAKLLFAQIKLKNADTIAKISAILFIFFANLSQFTNSGNNNENLAMLPLLGALYFYLKYRQKDNQKWYLLLIAGLLAGIVFTLKANFAILILPIVLDIIYLHRSKLVKAIYSLAIFGIATVAQLAIWALYFKNLGTFNNFWVATFEFNSKYIKALGWDLGSPGIMIFLLVLVLLLLFFAPFLLASIAKTRQILRSKTYNFELIVPLMAMSVLLFVIMAGTFYSHYFLVIIPYLCLVFGAALPTVISYKYSKILLFVGVGIVSLMLLISYKQLYNNFSGGAANELNNQQLVADYIKAHTEPNDKIFANVYGATLYRLAERDSGTRFISASHLLIDYKHGFGYDFNGTAISDLEKSKPKYIIISADPDDLYLTKNPVMTKYFNDNYTFEATVAGYQILVRK